MSSKRLFIVCWVLLLTSLHYGQCCDPAEIGQKYTIISATTVSPGDSVQWEILLNLSTVLYDSWKTSNRNIYPGLYFGTRTQLTILNVTKIDGKGVFQHFVNGVIVYTCKLPVFKRASTPTCEPVTLTGNQIRTKCSTDEVFPKGKCQFTLQNGGTDKRSIKDGESYITYTHTDPQSGGNEYYSTSCTLQYPVDGLKPGNWRVNVNMYPDQTGVSLAQGTVGHADNTLTLSIPTVNIDLNNCPKGLTGEGDTNVIQGYIKQGERASCLCTRAHPGNPPGTISWSSTQGGNFVVLSQSDDAATIQMNSPDKFICQSASVLDGPQSMTYTPRYAYGPSSASLTFQSPGPIYLCPNQQTNFDITCQVPANSLNPATLFTIGDSNSKSLVTKVAGDTAWSKSVSYNFTKSSQHTFTCRVENAIFSDIFSEVPAKAIEVYAPPNRPPSFEVTGQSVITDNSETWVKQGSNISVSCLAGEAYPKVKSVNVICGQSTSSSDQLFVSGVNGDELKCQCAVDHETKYHCNGHNLTKDITLQIAYGPSEVRISFTDDRFRERQNEPLDLCSSKGVDVTVICAVRMPDVRPRLTTSSFRLTKPNGFAITQQSYLDSSGGDYRSVNKMMITSGGSHSLICEARNPKFADINQRKNVTIEVRVPPNRPPSFQVTGQSVITDSSEPWVKQGSDIHVSCLAGEAYPSVKSVNVTCGQVTSSSGQLSVFGVSDDELACQCKVDHDTRTSCNGLNLYREIIMQTAYGPNEVSIRLTDDQLKELPNEPINLCSSEDIHSTIICAVKQSDVRPGLTMKEFILTKPSSMTTKQMYLDTSNGYYRFVNTLKINSGGNYTLICDARNPKFTDLMQTQFMTIEARKPPTTPPVVSARSRQNGDILVQGDDVTISCSVYGGYPSVHSVTLTCGQNHSVTSDGTSADITLNSVGPSNSVINCICLATHVTGCYDLMGVLPLNIFSVNPNKAEGYTSPMTTAEIAGTAIGSIVGILVLVAVIALIVFLIRRAKEKSRNRTKDTEYDKVRRQAPMPYQNVKPRDTTYQTVDHVEGAPNSASTSQKTERTYNNQAFGYDEEPKEPDPNVYIEIQDN